MKRKFLSFPTAFLCLLLLTGCGSVDAPEGHTLSAATDPAQHPTPAESSAAPSETLSIENASYEFSLPDEFEEMEVSGFACFYSAKDGSSVNLNLQPFDPSFEELSEELLHQSIDAVLSQTYDLEIPITDLSFEREPVSGFPAYQYAFSYELQGNTYRQLVIGINADQCYTFTYTDMSGNWTEAFQESARSISIAAP